MARGARVAAASYSSTQDVPADQGCTHNPLLLGEAKTDRPVWARRGSSFGACFHQILLGIPGDGQHLTGPEPGYSFGPSGVVAGVITVKWEKRMFHTLIMG